MVAATPLDAAALLHRLPDAVLVFNPTGQLRWASPSAVELLGGGQPRNLEATIEKVHPQDRHEVFHQVQQVRGGVESTVRGTWRLRTPDGSWLSVDTYFHDARGIQSIGGFVLTAREAVPYDLDDSGTFSSAARFAADGYWEWHIEGDRLDLSHEWLDTIGWVDVDRRFTSTDWYESVHADDRPRLLQDLSSFLSGQRERLRSEHRVLAGDGTWRWVQLVGSATRDGAGRATVVAGTLSDVSESKLTDRVTGLANALLFRDRLAHLWSASRRDGTPFSVLVLDIDRHPAVRESLGHQAGDSMLRSIGSRLGRTLRPGDTIARIGEARFGILVDSLGGSSEASRVAERLHNVLAEPIRIDDRDIFTTASVGIAVAGPGLDTPDDLLRAAETAMRRARSNSEERSAFYDLEMHRQARERLELETDLRRAVIDEAFEIHYQPIVELETGEVIGFESLVRWRNEARGGLVSPGLFIPIAEETGVILQIGRIVLRDSVRQLQAWRDAYPNARHLVVSVNVSPRELEQPALADRVEAILRDVGLPPTSLKLEVTETALMKNPEVATATLERLSAMGVSLALDDFGTGYSSLGYLHQMPINAIKIDRSFVKPMDDDGEAPVIVKSIIALAASLGMDCIAEGIETASTGQLLRDLGCKYGQGWHFGRPIPARETARRLFLRAS